MKKGGAGEHNWGDFNDIIEEGLNEELYEGTPSTFEQPELEQDTTPPTTTTIEEKKDVSNII